MQTSNTSVASAGRLAALALVAASWTSTAAMGATPALPFTLKPIGPGVYAAIDGPEGRSGSNAGFIIGDDGVLVVDSFFNPEATKALVGEIRRLTPLPIRYVVNTHYHADHVGGDGVLREAGAVIIAHRNVRSWVRTENLHLFGDRITAPMKAMVASLALPDVGADTGLTIWLGARKVVIRTVLGHTGGDLVVGVPDAKALFCGDILWRHVSPNIIDGDVARWIETIDSLKAADGAADSTFVPGHGDTATVKDVAAFGAYLGDLTDLVRRERATGLSGEALVKAALPEFAKAYGDWTLFGHFAPLELRFEDEELAGTKRRPTAGAD